MTRICWCGQYYLNLITTYMDLATSGLIQFTSTSSTSNIGPNSPLTSETPLSPSLSTTDVISQAITNYILFQLFVGDTAAINLEDGPDSISEFDFDAGNTSDLKSDGFKNIPTIVCSSFPTHNNFLIFTWWP